ncbi:hypothetical protein M0R45_003573 [Rubus argutus]|uniref:Serine aminopeptidase S33 domain-containing protein n=1 Tax=Rubus argutus TaxID=59490 RepID=A0AAW1YI04_RUBAR
MAPAAQNSGNLVVAFVNCMVSVNQPEKIIITNRHGEKLVGLLHETGSRELVILCHGARSHKGDNIMTKLALALENEGISVFRFDFAGNGESEGTFQFGHYWREVDDLHDVIQHFSGTNHTVSAILGPHVHHKLTSHQPDLSSLASGKFNYCFDIGYHCIENTILLHNVAAGGDEVLLYASKYGDVRTVVNVSGRYDLNGGLELRLGKNFMEVIKKQGYMDIKDKTGSFDCRVTEESLLDRMSTNMHESCLKIDKDCRVLTAAIEQDKTSSN